MAMDRVASSRTYIVIAHRLSTVQNAAAIAVLKDGVVAEVGTHAELLAKGGLYADLWAKHAREGDGNEEGAKEAPVEAAVKAA